MSFYFCPDGLDRKAALARAKVLGIGAHPDDLEFMCLGPIARAQTSRTFAGLVVTNGAGSSRSGAFAKKTDAEMIQIRKAEQIEAAKIGAYSFVEMWDLESKALKDPSRLSEWTLAMKKFLGEVQPETLYTHNPFDRHISHVVLTLVVLQALRSMPKESRPKEIWGCEVWRGLDWMPYQRTHTQDISQADDLQRQLVNVFRSQIDGGKAYDEAVLGRKRVNAVFRESHATDESSLVELYLNLNSFVESPKPLDQTLSEALDDFKNELMHPIQKYTLKGK